MPPTPLPSYPRLITPAFPPAPWRQVSVTSSDSGDQGHTHASTLQTNLIQHGGARQDRPRPTAASHRCSHARTRPLDPFGRTTSARRQRPRAVRSRPLRAPPSCEGAQASTRSREGHGTGDHNARRTRCARRRSCGVISAAHAPSCPHSTHTNATANRTCGRFAAHGGLKQVLSNSLAERLHTRHDLPTTSDLYTHGESAGKLAMGEREERAVALFADWVRSDGRLIFTGRLGNVRRHRRPHSRPRPPQADVSLLIPVRGVSQHTHLTKPYHIFATFVMSTRGFWHTDVDMYGFSFKTRPGVKA
jgi:hypothetical protein